VIRTRYNYLVAQAGAYVGIGDFQSATQSYRQALQEMPSRADIWRVEEALASLYAQMGDFDNALIFGTNAMMNAPESERPRLEAFLNQFQRAP
jgi:tetratricopeptide (TPR) repeat protein